MKRRVIRHKDEQYSLPTSEQEVYYHPYSKKKFFWTKKRLQHTLLGLSTFVVILFGFTRHSVALRLVGGGTTSSDAEAPRRFPKHGSYEFAQQCNWTMLQKEKEPDCTFLLRVYPDGNEGIAEWISKAASAHISARQTGCSLLMDYGDSVDLQQVLKPVSMDWTIPSGFQCLRSSKCVNVSTWTATHLAPEPSMHATGKELGKTLVRVPYYRFAYIGSPFLYPKMYHDLKQELAGFRLETGMACSLGSLFDLAPSVSQFMPDLFTKILPTLRDERALVMAVYIRSGFTDKMASAEKEGKAAEESTKQYQHWAAPCLECAVNVEQKYLLESEETGISFSRIVWMFVTDSAYLKEWVSETYDSRTTKEKVSVNKFVRNSKAISREILTTTSRGVQTRSARNPSTADFAEAFIDWYLIGESDLVVTNNRDHTFGATASLRTTRPLYDPKGCSEIPRFGPPRFKSALEHSQQHKAKKIH